MELEALDPGDQELADALAHVRQHPTPAQRARIMAAVSTASAEAPALARQGRHRRFRWGLAVPGGLAALGMSATVALGASGSALPGSPAYAARGLWEQLQLVVAPGGETVALRTRFAADRLHAVAAHRSPADRPLDVELLKDARVYLGQAARDVKAAPTSQQGQLEQEIESLVDEEHRDEVGMEEQAPSGSTQEPSHAGPAPEGSDGNSPAPPSPSGHHAAHPSAAPAGDRAAEPSPEPEPSQIEPSPTAG